MDMSTIVESLKRHLGTGTRPDLRIALYKRVAETVAADDTGRAEKIVASVIADSAGKGDPGRYFSYVVVQRLEERGFSMRASFDLASVFASR